MESIERKDPIAIPEEPVKTEEIVSNPDSNERNNSAPSPPPNCSICLGKLINTSFTDSCLHQFCFTCLLQWSKIKTECPLCKQTFKSIIHNVRSEEDYDQYHVQYTSQVAATIDVDFDFQRRRWDIVGVEAPVQPFMYRTTLGANRRYGMLLNPEAVARREQIPSISTPRVPLEERRRRVNNPIDYRRTVYRTGVWAHLLPEAFGRFRECNAEYYRRNPSEVNRLIPWLNRELQVLLNNNRPHIAYVLNVITDTLTQYDIYGPDFRNIVRPYFGIHTEHFVHELANFARTNYDLVGYDQAVTYIPHRGLSNQYLSRTVSPTPSTSSTSSSDSDVRVLNDTGLVYVNTLFPHNAPSVGPHIIDMPGSSTFEQTLRVQPSYTAPDVLTISSTSSSSENECEVIGYVKPRHERTPEIIDLSLSETEIQAARSSSSGNTQSEAVLPYKDENLPSTSSSNDNNSSRRTRRQAEDIVKAQMFDWETTSESNSDETDSDYNPSSKSRSHKSSSKKTSKPTSRKLRNRKKSSNGQHKRKEHRNRSTSCSCCSDAESPEREATSSKGRKRYLSKSSDGTNSEKTRKKSKKNKKSKSSKKNKKRVSKKKNYNIAYSNSSSSNCDSDSERDNPSKKYKRIKIRIRSLSPLNPTYPRCSSEEPSTNEKSSNKQPCNSGDSRSSSSSSKSRSSRINQRKKSVRKYSADSDFSDHRRSAASSRHSSCGSIGSQKNQDKPIEENEESRYSTASDEESRSNS